MQVHVKTPHIRVDIRGGEIPIELLEAVKALFDNKDIEIIDNEGDEYVDWFETEEHREIADNSTPGDVMKIYRENCGWTQAKLGQQLGGLSRQKVSDMEKGHRTISGDTAIALSRLFGVAVERFRPRQGSKG